MPRISYLDKSKNGLDDTETTVAQIEEKVAEITDTILTTLQNELQKENKKLEEDQKNNKRLKE